MAEKTVREQMAEALEHAQMAGIGAEEATAHEHNDGSWGIQCRAAAEEARAALDRYRNDPEEEHCRDCGSSDCSCYQEGLEAQRERVGGTA